MSKKIEWFGRIPEEAKPINRRTPEEKRIQLKARRKAEDIKLAKELGIDVKELDK